MHVYVHACVHMCACMCTCVCMWGVCACVFILASLLYIDTRTFPDSFVLALQSIPEEFSIKAYVIELLEESKKVEQRPKNMDIDDFLRWYDIYIQFVILLNRMLTLWNMAHGIQDHANWLQHIKSTQILE